MMVHISEMLGLHQCLVVSMVTYLVGHGHRMEERLKMVDTPVGNYCPLKKGFELWVS
jgi:hypothetical protein